MIKENELDYEKIILYLGQMALMNAYNIVNGPDWIEKPNGEKIIFLHNLGFSNEDIVKIVDTTSGTVRKEISIRSNKQK